MNGMTRVPLPRRLRLARAALAYAALLSLFLTLGLPVPTRASLEERLSALTLLAIAAGALFAAVALTRRRRAGWAVAVGVGLLATHITALRAAFFVGRVTSPYAGPAEVASRFLAGTALLALVAAMLCCLSVRDWRTRLR